MWTRKSPRRCCRAPTRRASPRPWHFTHHVGGRGPEGRHRAALLAYALQTALNAALAIRDGRLDAAEAAVAALQAAGYQTAAQVASAIATALLGYASTGDLADYATAADGGRDLLAERDRRDFGAAGCSDHRRRAEPDQRAGLARRDHLGPAGGHHTFAERQLHAESGLRQLQQGRGGRPAGAQDLRELGAGHAGWVLHQRRNQQRHRHDLGAVQHHRADGRRHRHRGRRDRSEP